MKSCACASLAARSTSSSVASGAPEGDVLADGRREEERVLRDDADLAPQRLELHVADVDAVDRDPSLGRVVEPGDERCERRLAGPGVTDQRDGSARLQLEVDLVEHGPAGCVLERHALVVDAAFTRRHLGRIRLVGDLLGLVHDLEDPLAGGGRALRLADPHAEHAERPHEHHHEDVEEEERLDVERSVGDHPAALEQDARLHDQRQEREQRHVEGALLVRVDAALEDPLRPARELVELVLLLGERLDDVDADDVLLGDRRDVGHLLLDVAEHGVGDTRVAVREDDDQRCHGSRDERELPVDEEHDHGRADDRQHVLEEEDEPVAEEEADGLEVDRRAREQLARLMPVVEAEREPEQLRVERVPHVVLDGERLAARDQAASGHEQRAEDADDDDGDGDSVELVMAVRRDCVLEAASRQVRDDDRSGLGADREE